MGDEAWLPRRLLPEASKCFTQLKFSLEGGGEKLCKASNLEGKGGEKALMSFAGPGGVGRWAQVYQTGFSGERSAVVAQIGGFWATLGLPWWEWGKQC